MQRFCGRTSLGCAGSRGEDGEVAGEDYVDLVCYSRSLGFILSAIGLHRRVLSKKVK